MMVLSVPYGQFLTGIPKLEPVREGIKRIVTEVAFCDRLGLVWRAPAGWATDGASIPTFARKWLDPFDPDYLRSAVLHDVRFCVHDLPFRDANVLFRDCLTREGWVGRDLFWLAVNSPCGWWSYHMAPDLPENADAIVAMRRKFEQEGPEIWKPS